MGTGERGRKQKDIEDDLMTPTFVIWGIQWVVSSTVYTRDVEEERRSCYRDDFKSSALN